MEVMEKVITLGYDEIFKNIKHVLRSITKKSSDDDLDYSTKVIKIELKNLKVIIDVKSRALEKAKELLLLQAEGFVCYPDYINDDSEILENNAKFILKKINEIENMLKLEK